MMPKTRRKWLILITFYSILLACLLITLLGCASTRQQEAYGAGALSQQLAEQTFSALYRAYRAGQLSDAEMTLARTSYDRWALAQHRYVTSMQDGREDPEAVAAVTTALQTLMALAHQGGVL